VVSLALALVVAVAVAVVVALALAVAIPLVLVLVLVLVLDLEHATAAISAIATRSSRRRTLHERLDALPHELGLLDRRHVRPSLDHEELRLRDLLDHVLRER
jgi:hypothetical protein